VVLFFVFYPLDVAVVEEIFHDKDVLLEGLACNAVLVVDLVDPKDLGEGGVVLFEDDFGHVLKVGGGELEKGHHLRAGELLNDEAVVGGFGERGARLAALGLPLHTTCQ